MFEAEMAPPMGATLPAIVCNIGIGFINPAVGTFQSNIAFDPDYNQLANSAPVLANSDFLNGTINCCDSGIVSSSSCVYKGTSTAGQPTGFHFTGQAVSGQICTVVIQQVSVSV